MPTILQTRALRVRGKIRKRKKTPTTELNISLLKIFRWKITIATGPTGQSQIYRSGNNQEEQIQELNHPPLHLVLVAIIEACHHE